MGEGPVINLRQARKARARAEKRAQADANAAKFGQSKSARLLAQRRAALARARLDQLRIETAPGSFAQDPPHGKQPDSDGAHTGQQQAAGRSGDAQPLKPQDQPCAGPPQTRADRGGAVRPPQEQE